MCLQGKRKKFMYLSMCSCCNLVSKYPSTVKRHLKTDHFKVPNKKGLKAVIPIRLKERDVRNIKWSLDKKGLAKKNEGQKQRISTSSNDTFQTGAFKESFLKERAILCTVCKKKFEGLVSFFCHMSAQDHKNVRIGFKCTECSGRFPSIKELLEHNKMHTSTKDLNIFKLDCVYTSESNVKVTQCPYCVTMIGNIEQLYLHIGDKHFTCLEVTKIKVDSEKVVEEKEETDLLSYKCKYCPDSLHDLGDFLLHMEKKHSSHQIQASRPPRKRTLPKWLEESSYEEMVKRSKNVKYKVASVSDQVETCNKSVSGKEKRKPVKVSNKSVESNDELLRGKERKQERAVVSSDLSPLVLLKRINNELEKSSLGGSQSVQSKDTFSEKSDTDNVKKNNSEENVQSKNMKYTDHDYSCPVITEERKTKTEILKKERGEIKPLETVNCPKLATSSQTDERHIISDCIIENFSGDSDDDYVVEMELKKADEPNMDTNSDEVRCKYCENTEFTHTESLDKHIQENHPHVFAVTEISKAIKDGTKETESHKTDVETDSKFGKNITPESKGLVLKDHIKNHDLFTVQEEEEKTDGVKEIREIIVGDEESNYFLSVTKFKCPFCEFYLYHSEYVFSHIKINHPEIQHFSAGDIVKETVIVHQTEVNRESFYCPECDFISNWKNVLLQHFFHMHADKPPIKNLPCILPDCYSVNGASKEKFICPKCKISVEGKGNFEKHFEKHTGGGEKKFKIQYRCSLPLFETEAMSKTCKRLVSFLCPYCDVVFSRKEALKYHKCSENPEKKLFQVIKCVLMKPTCALSGKRQCTDRENAKSIKEVNDDLIQMNVDTHTVVEEDSIVNLDAAETGHLRNGIYICPVCDDFKTLHKDEAVRHAAIFHKDKVHHIDLLYILEAFLDRKRTAGNYDGEHFSIRCKSCDFSSDCLTDILRHSMKHETNVDESISLQDTRNTKFAGKINDTDKAVAERITLQNTLNAKLVGKINDTGKAATGNLVIENARLKEVNNRETVEPNASHVVKSVQTVSLLSGMSQQHPLNKCHASRLSSVLVKQKKIMSNYRVITLKDDKDGGYQNDKTVTVTKFKCPFCAFYLYHKEYVYSHVQNIHPEVEHFTPGDIVKETLNLKEHEVDREYFKCPHCDFTSKWKNVLLLHLRSNHSEKQVGKITCILPVSELEKGSPKEMFICPVCRAVFAGKDSFGKHMVDHLSGKQCSLQPQFFLTDPETVAKPLKKLVSWLCPYCALVFTRKDSVKSHLSTHLEDTNKQKYSIIKCVLVKPTSSAANEMDIINFKQVELTKLDSTAVPVTDINIQNSVETTCSNSKLRNGTFICPICDNFHTLSKDQAVLHMESNHKNKIPEVDLMYIVEALLERKESSFIISCHYCDYNSDNLTDVVRHQLFSPFTCTAFNKCKRKSNIHARTKGIQDNEGVSQIVENGTSSSVFEVVLKGSREVTGETYVCWICRSYRTFKSRRYLKQHMDKNHKDSDMSNISALMNEMVNTIEGTAAKGYKCLLCGDQVEMESELIQHFKDKHPKRVHDINCQMNKAKVTVCEVCHARCSNNAFLRKHLLLHVNRRRTHCPTCGIYLETSEEVATHSLNVHSKSSQMCNICGRIFMKNKDFNRHMRGHDADVNATDSKTLCQHCGTEVMKHSFKRHLLRHHAAEVTCDCEICTRQIVPVGKRPIKCRSCGTTVCSAFMLDAHTRKTHPKINPHKVTQGHVLTECRCVRCGMTFGNIFELHGHDCSKAVEHGNNLINIDTDNLEVSDNGYGVGEKITADMSADFISENFLEFNGSLDLPYSCRLCDKSFKIKKYLYNHVRRQHADDKSKRYRCKICKMSFNKMNALKRHCKFHIGLRPYQCKMCSRSFKTLSQMKEHMRIHTEKTNPKLMCRYCERKFIQNGALMAHVMYHCKLKPFICPYCEKGYASSGELRRHMERYLDDKDINLDTFPCSYCKEQFPNKRFLMKHFYKHGPENPFQCATCQKRFRSFQQMYTHKHKTNHFTIEEIEEAKAELKKPSGNFRPMDERKELWNKRKMKGDMSAETAVATSVMNTSLALAGSQSSEPVFDDQGYIEVEISNNTVDIPDESTKLALSLFENNVMQSMFEIDKSENESEEEGQVVMKYDQQNQNEYLFERMPYCQEQPAVVLDEASKGGIDIEQDEQFHIESEPDSVSELATIVAQNIQCQETGQSQAYQTPDGSVIHVCVIKSNRH